MSYWQPVLRYDTLIFDLGGVLMKHNMQGCINSFVDLLGEDKVRHALGLGSDGEGATDSLMIRYEQGLVSTDEFINAIMEEAKPGTTRQDVINAWLSMHDHIPEERLQYVRMLRNQGYRTVLLSNNNDLHWHDVMSKYPVSECFDRFFLSHEMHLSKPDPCMFIQIAEVLDTAPERTVFIDDLEQNRIAAEQTVGWHTCADIEELKQMLISSDR